MDNNNIILSICIPTYNRSGYLRETILSIVNQRRFIDTSDVEIIISDNCSSDDTSRISSEFVEKYGEKVKYFRNEKNIVDGNFEKSLSHGQGLFLKLNNDTLKHHDGSLDKILEAIDANRESRNILFFSNGALSSVTTTICENLNSFIAIVSFYSTWIGAFGLWKEHFAALTDFNKCSYLHLTQVDVLFRLINSHKRVYVNNEKVFISLPVSKKGGYDILTVFMDNYLFILTENLNNQSLNKETFVSEKRKLLLNFIRPWLVSIRINPERYSFGYKNSIRRIFNCYRNDIKTFIVFIFNYQMSLSLNYIKKTFINQPETGVTEFQ